MNNKITLLISGFEAIKDISDLFLVDINYKYTPSYGGVANFTVQI